MKEGSALERLAAIDAAAFDKTGTLTTGEPHVIACAIPAGEPTAIAKTLAIRSMHPAARALARHLGEVPQVQLTKLREVPGHGVEARMNDRMVRLGRRSWVGEIAAGAVPDGTGIAFALEGKSITLTQLGERLRAGARSMIHDFQKRGIRLGILSGDTDAQVGRIARQLGVKSFTSDMKPGEKLGYLAEAARRGQKILMVGDGLNDAPALAAAHVSMAPSSGSDIGRQAADFVFTRDSLTSVSFAHHVSVATGKIVRQNFALAIVYNLFAVPLAVAGQLNPLMAAIAMSTSSIIVVGNSLRLYRLGIGAKDGIALEKTAREAFAT